VGGQVGSGLNQLRYVLAGLLIVTVGIFGYQAYDTNRKQEEARIERQIYKDQTAQAMSMWDSRNNCVKAEWEKRWRAWYLENPETQTINVADVTSGIINPYEVTKTLPLPESIDKVRWGGTGSSNFGVPDEWYVSQQHFKGFEIMIRYECELKFPPPVGLSESDVDEGSMGLRVSLSNLTPTGLDAFEIGQRYRWQDPFILLGSRP